MALSAVAIKSAKSRDKPYKLADRDGLYLVVWPTGARSWKMNYRYLSKQKTLTFGQWPAVSLADARKKRYTHLSYAAIGMDYLPQVHLGAGLTAKVRRGEEVALNELNRLTVARNSALQCLREIRSVLQASAAAVSDYVRKERDAVVTTIAFPPAKSVQSATSIDIAGSHYHPPRNCSPSTVTFEKIGSQQTTPKRCLGATRTCLPR